MADDNDTFEKKLFQKAKVVPGVGMAYGLVRMFPYAVTGDRRECLKSATGMLGNMAETVMMAGGFAAGGPAGAVGAMAASAGVWAGIDQIEAVDDKLNKK